MRLFFSLVFLGLSVTSARAQILDETLDTVTETLTYITDEVLVGITNFRAGAGPVLKPDYRGSNNYKVSFTPLLSFKYRDVLQFDNNRIRINIFGSDSIIPTENFTAGPSLSVDFGRDEKANPALEGLGDVGASGEIGIFASYKFGPTRLRLRMRRDVTSSFSGMKIAGDFRVVVYNKDKTTMVGAISSSWVDNDYMEKFYGVTPEQSLSSGLPEFDPSSGIMDVSLQFGLNQQISSKWAAIIYTNYTRLLGDVANSPIVDQSGSPSQISLSGGYSLFIVFKFTV